MELWGKDHWSTLGYLECRAVDNKGFIKNDHMRCNPRIHREFAHAGSFMGKSSPTRLKNGEMEQHDDWSCVEDMVAGGLIVMYWKPISDEPFGCNVARVLFTDKGLTVVQSLRRHKMAGGTFSNFEWKEGSNESASSGV